VARRGRGGDAGKWHDLYVDYAYELMCLQLWMDTLTDSPCSDKRVRQAIDYGIDKKAIWEGLMAPVGRLNGHVLTPDVFGCNPDIEQTPYDPDKARQLLAEAGYADGLDLEIQTAVGKYLVDRDGCIVIADQLADIGINLTVNVVEPATFLDYLSHNDKRCDMIYLGWYSYGNPSQALQWFATQTPWHKWENEEYSDLFLAAKSSLDEEERLAMYHRMAEIVKEEAPTVPLYQQAAPYGVNNEVVNWRPHPDQQFYLVGVDLER